MFNLKNSFLRSVSSNKNATFLAMAAVVMTATALQPAAAETIGSH